MSCCKTLLIALVVGAGTFQGVFAQAARSVPTTPTQTETAANPSQADAAVASSCAATEKVVYVPPRRIEAFVEELNRLGKCGYRLLKADKLRLRTEPSPGSMYVFGILQSDPGNKYEYEWFQANSPGAVVTAANSLAENGFYFRQSMMFTWLCGKSTPDEEDERGDPSPSGDTGGRYSSKTNGSVFIFERANGVLKKNRYRVLNGSDMRGTGNSLERNQEILNSHVAEGYRPVGIYYLGEFDAFAIIAEKDEAAAAPEKGDYKLLRYKLNPGGKFTELGREGYQPVMVGMFFAVLHRKNKDAVPVSYLSVDKFEELGKKLPKYPGAGYQVKGFGLYDFDCDMSLNKLFFAVPLPAAAGNTRKREQQFVRMTNVLGKKFKKKEEKERAYADPPSAETMQNFRELLREGYTVSDVFDSGEVTVIFERELE